MDLFGIAQRLILDHQAEILNVSQLFVAWTRSNLTQNQVSTWTKANVYVYSDPVLFLRNMSEHSEADQRWKHQDGESRQSNSNRELFWNWWRTDWFSSELETLNLKSLKIESSSCQCSMTSIGKGFEIQKEYFKFRTSQEFREEIPARTLDIPRPWRRNEVGRNSQLHTWRNMEFHRFTDGGTIQRNWSPSISRASVLWVVKFGTERNNRDTIHFNADSSNTQPLFRTSHSANCLVSTEQSQDGVKILVKSQMKRVDIGKVRGKRKRAATEHCEAAWSEFQGVIIQHLEKDCENVFRDLTHWRMMSNLQSVWRCVVLEKSLCWDELQNHSWRGWWFWRSKPYFLRVHIYSCSFRFFDLCSNSRTNYNWTTSWSSYQTTSWHQWIFHSDSIHNNERFYILGGDMSIVKPPRGGVTSQWSRSQSNKFWIANGKICCKRKWTLFCRDGAT